MTHSESKTGCKLQTLFDFKCFCFDMTWPNPCNLRLDHLSLSLCLSHSHSLCLSVYLCPSHSDRLFGQQDQMSTDNYQPAVWGKGHLQCVWVCVYVWTMDSAVATHAPFSPRGSITQSLCVKDVQAASQLNGDGWQGTLLQRWRIW